MKTVIALFLLCVICPSVPAIAAQYGVARTAAPVLNTPAFSQIFGGTDRKTLKTDRCGQVRELEFIALPGTVFRIRSEITDGVNTIFRVETDDYPTHLDADLYLDSRFVEIRQEKPRARHRYIPDRADILANLKKAIGTPYVWGGNMQEGVDELLDLFYGSSVPGPYRKRLTLSGLDCSGLLYQATGGWTPRNTSQLVSFGKEVRISGKSSKEIAGLLEPLDLIVWNGHLLIVLDHDTAIESRLVCGKPGNGGVVSSSLQKRLAGIMRTRRPVDRWPTNGKQRDVFVVRRWY
jgi:hypothetical protein